MSVSTSAFEQLLLAGLWWTSIVLLLASLVLVGVLILRRAMAERRSTHAAGRARVIRRQLYAALKPAVLPDVSIFPPLEAGDAAVAVRESLDLLRATRGADAERIQSLLSHWGIERYLSQAAGGGPQGDRIRALTLLGFFDTGQARTTLLNNAGSSNTDVRLSALRALARHGAHIDLLALCQDMPETTNYLMLADVLSRFREEAVDSLCALAESSAHHPVRLAAVMALGRIGARAAAPGLARLAVADSSVDIRAQAVAALGELGDMSAGDTILRAFEDPEFGVRAQAVAAAGKLQLPRALPLLLDLLDDEQWWVRFRAAQSLIQFGDRGTAMLSVVARQSGPAALIAGDILAEHGVRHG